MSFLLNQIKRLFKFFLSCLWQVVLSAPLVAIALISRNKKKTKFVFGSTPIINNKYWINALKGNYDAISIMKEYYNINKKNDFNFYFEDFVPRLLKKFSFFLGKYFALIYVLRNARVIHMSFDGFSLEGSILKRLEIILFRIAQCRVIILPYGGDGYIYSAIHDLSLRNALIASYPHLYDKENQTRKQVHRLLKYCDIYLSGAQTDGIHHWSISPFNMLCIDMDKDLPKKLYSHNAGKGKEIIIVHSTNHQQLKGSEFIISAIDDLKKEGCAINFILLEKVQNSVVLESVSKADILIDQLIIGYYGLAAVEGMSIGTPVICNMENKEFTTVFRRYSFLNECPIVSATPENIKDVLRILIAHPKLRKELGRAGRQYVEKYHSYKTAQYMFGAIYAKIIDNKDVDLINLFHPILSEYNNSTPLIQHSLKNNQIPEKYFKGLA